MDHSSRGAHSSAGPRESRKALAAASWPAAAALFCAAYALQPELFPPGTGEALLIMAAAEIPCLFLGVVHAAALQESSRRGRYATFLIGLVVLLLLGGGPVLFDVEFRSMLPALGWVLVSYLIALWTADKDPQLAHDQAWAVLMDRGTLLALIPAVVIGSVLLAIFLQVGSLLSGGDFSLWVSNQLNSGDPSMLALIPGAYLAASALSTGYVHGEAFVRSRKRLLDRPWVHALTNSSKPSE